MKTKTLILTFAVITALSSTTVFAAQTVNSSNTGMNNKNMMGPQNRMENRFNSMETSLKTLVTSGVITESQASSILEALSPSKTNNGSPLNCSNRPERKGMFNMIFDKFVSDGIITASEETKILDSISSKLTALKSEIPYEKVDMKTQLKSIIEGLANDSIITSSQEEKMLSDIETCTPQFEPRGMDNRAQNILDVSVKNSVITSSQEESILSAIKEAKPSEPSADSTAKMNFNNNLKSILDSLVNKAVITNAQETKILTSFQNATPQEPGERMMEHKMGNMTPASTAQNRDTTTKIARINPMKEKLDALVTNGIITQYQEDAVIKAITPLRHFDISNQESTNTDSNK